MPLGKESNGQTFHSVWGMVGGDRCPTPGFFALTLQQRSLTYSVPSDKSQLRFCLSRNPKPVLLVGINLIELPMGKFIVFVVFVTLEPAPPVNQIYSYFCE